MRRIRHKFMRLTVRVVIMAVLVLVSAGFAFAIPPVINYQGKLVDSVGDPVNNSVDITFTIYNAPTDGDVLWTETQTVGVVNGIFNVYLGSIEEIYASTFDNDIVYLGVKVGTNAEMTPRQLYSAAPFAFRAHSADMVADGAVTSAMITNGTILGEDIATDTITSNEIAAGAVTSSEIADGTITDIDISNDSINSGKIIDGEVTTLDILDGTISGADIGDGAVDSTDILDGTITDADISASASISALKINPNGLNADKLDGRESTEFFDKPTYDLDADGVMDSANNADTLDGEDSSVFSRKYEKIAVVAKSGGDYTSPVAAANDYLTWCGTPSMTNPCLIKVMPGIYDIGPDTVVLQPLLNIEGSGINSTAITGTVSSYSAGVINGAATSEIKHLTVQNSGGGTYAVAIYNNYNAANDTLRIYDVRAMAGGATKCYTIFNDDYALAEIRTVTAFANCTGQNMAIYSDLGSEIIIENTNIEVSDGSSDAYGIEFSSTASSFMSNVRVKAFSDGTTSVSGVFYSSATGEMHNVMASASGGYPSGILIRSNSNVIMKNVTATASDAVSGKDTSGIYINWSDVDMSDVSIEASSSSATDNVHGLNADVSGSGSLNMKGIRISATGGVDCYGIYATNNSNGHIRMTDVQSMSSCDTARGIIGFNGNFIMHNVEAYGSGESSGTGISLFDAYAGMQDVEALGYGNSNNANFGIYMLNLEIEGMNVNAHGEGSINSTNYGLYVADAGCQARITGGYIKSYGGATGYGIYLNDGSVELNGVKVQAAGASNNTGIEGGGGTGGTITLRHSVIEGTDYTVNAFSGYFFSAATTGFIGTVPSGGMAIQCVNSYQELGGVLIGLDAGCIP